MKGLKEQEKKRIKDQLIYCDGVSKYEHLTVENPGNSTLHPCTHYKNFKTKEILSECSGMQEGEFIKSSISDYDWKYSDDTDTILGYLCHSAYYFIKGKKTTAWYTQEIPIMDGPKKLSGLPGLILKYETSSGTTWATAVNILDPKTTTVEIPEVKTTISKEDFRKSIIGNANKKN